MAEKYRFFDSVDGKDEREYSADEFAEYFRQLVTSGIFNGGENLRVITEGTNMTIKIQEGYAWLEGYLYKIDNEPLALTLDAADPALNRIDRIIIRLDKTLDNRYVKAFVLKGNPSEEPIAPSLTRDENIYEISLAQIEVLAGKSFIGEAEIKDERFNGDVCGIVNSLIKVDTQHLIDRFEDEWHTWYNGIKDETFVPIGNLKDGFIRTPEDLVHAIPDKKIQVEKGWPVNKSNIEFNNSRIDENNDLCIDFFQQGGNLFRYDVLEDEVTLSSDNLYGNRRLAFPLKVNRNTNHLRASMILKRESIGRLNTIIYEANDEGLPDLEKIVGSYYPTTYTDIPSSTFSRATWSVPLDETLVTEKQYFIVIYGYNASYYINAAYVNTPGEIKYYYTTDGVTWTPYERTPFLEINGLVDEGSVTITHKDKNNFSNHLFLDVDIKDKKNSSYIIDVLDTDSNVIMSDVKSRQQLLNIDPIHYKEIKTRIKLIRSEIEDPKLTNYQYTWIRDISTAEVEQAMMPSDDTILGPVSTAKSSTATIYAHVRYSGKYRLKCEIKTNNASVNAIVTVYENSSSYGNRIGYASIKGDVYTPVTIDLESVASNSKIAIVLTSSNNNYPATIRNVELCGEYGFQNLELTGY